jgi:hypothetical protein
VVDPDPAAELSAHAWDAHVAAMSAELLGQPESVAAARAEAAGLTVSLLRTDEPGWSMAEYAKGRVTLYSEAGIVIRVEPG